MLEMLSYLIKFAVEGAAVLDSSMSSSFYVDNEDDPDESEEVLFCKNNICVHLSSLNDPHTPGYFTVKSKTRRSGHVRLLVAWTPNSFFRENDKAGLHCADDPKGLLISELSSSASGIFSVNLTEMKTLKLFYEEEDPTCGQFVIGNFENHYKVFHFHHGGLERINQILDDWNWCASENNHEDIAELRRKCFTIISKQTPERGFHPEEGRFDPMPIQTWRTYFNSSGQIVDVANFRKVQ